MRACRKVVVLALLLVCVLASVASAVVLDTFTDPLPANPCLPVTALPIVFYGAFICDGSSCPPYAYSSCAWRTATQSGLTGVLSGKRRELNIYGAAWGGLMKAEVRTELGVVEVMNDGPYNHALYFLYGTRYAEPDETLALDLSGLAGFRVPVSGTVSPSEPMELLVQLWGGPGDPRPNADALVPITASGDVLVPLSAFTTRYGFSFSDVRGIEIGVGDCHDSECPEEPWPARSYTIGPITVDALPTPVAGGSWGTLKTRYR